MENQIKTFTNEMFGSIRSIIVDGDVWFVAKDIAKALDYHNTEHMVRRLEEDEKVTINNPNNSSDNLNPDPVKGSGFKYISEGNGKCTIYINEPGLYNSILGSKKPEAKEFKRWVMHEVLPSIRKTGSYSVNGGDELTQRFNLIAESFDKLATISSNNAVRLSNIESDVSDVKDRLNVIESKMDSIPTPSVRVSRDERSHVLNIAKQYSELTHYPYNDTLDWMVQQYSKYRGIRIGARARHQEMSPIEYIYQNNMIIDFDNFSTTLLNDDLSSHGLNNIN